MAARLFVQRHTQPVPPSSTRFERGQVVSLNDSDEPMSKAREIVSGNYLHIIITNRTVEQAQKYLEQWKHRNPVVNQIQSNGNLRRIEATTANTATNGKGGFTQVAIEYLLETYIQNAVQSKRAEITIDENLDYINAGIDTADRAARKSEVLETAKAYISADTNASYVSHTTASFKFNLVAEVEAKDAVIEAVSVGLNQMQIDARRWYIPEASCQIAEAAGGIISGTANQVDSHLNDGFLD